MVSIAIAVFPVCLSPIINSLCPLPIGIIESIAFMPVFKGTETGSRSTTPAAIFSRGMSLPFLIFALLSRGFPKGSITLPSNSSDTFTERISPVDSTISPSLIPVVSPKGRMEVLSSSRFNTGPAFPSLKVIFSPIIAFDRPEATITPSAFLITVPIFRALLSSP